MNDILHIATELETISTLIADAIIKKTAPASDELSEREASKLYGYGWVTRMRDSGMAKVQYTKGKNIYSRHQLNCLKMAETEAQIKIKSL